ncbi:uncharacterized protein LOC124776561 [Schistocerca piceifrons]|uniref:uncharacterized protein LOC124776561 n=1 Tax=Schistocerca piceifrons TaxID=274613 RepID=UPI001F5FF2FA|nr:uncharacterized protein LOC124776561 [Schistocerca piceifrons]
MAVKYFKYLLEGRDFVIYNDHAPLTYAFQQNEKFTTDLRRISGKAYVVADNFSRLEELVPTGKQLWCDVPTKSIRPCIPEQFRYAIFQHYHNWAHPSIKTTVKMITSRCVRMNMKKDIANWSRAGNACQKKNNVSRHVDSPIGHFPNTDERFKVINLDLIGPMPPSDEYTYCLTCIDRVTNWAELLQALSKRCGCNQTQTTAYHPQSNAKIEKFHRTLNAAIRSHSTTKWTQTIPAILLGLRYSIRENANATIAEMVYGLPIKIPGDLFQEVGTKRDSDLP